MREKIISVFTFQVRSLVHLRRHDYRNWEQARRGLAIYDSPLFLSLFFLHLSQKFFFPSSEKFLGQDVTLMRQLVWQIYINSDRIENHRTHIAASREKISRGFSGCLLSDLLREISSHWSVDKSVPFGVAHMTRWCSFTRDDASSVIDELLVERWCV